MLEPVERRVQRVSGQHLRAHARKDFLRARILSLLNQRGQRTLYG